MNGKTGYAMDSGSTTMDHSSDAVRAGEQRPTVRDKGLQKIDAGSEFRNGCDAAQLPIGPGSDREREEIAALHSIRFRHFRAREIDCVSSSPACAPECTLLES